MNTRRVIAIILLMMIAMGGCFAAIASRPSVSMSFGGNFCHPTADYLNEYPGDPSVEMPPFRSSLAFGIDGEILNISFLYGRNYQSSLQFGFGLSFIGVTASLPYGISVLKPYWGIGALADIDWRINAKWDLCFKYRFLACRYSESSHHFLAQDFSIVPGYRITNHGILDLSVGIPVTLSWKADAITIRGAVAFTLEIDSFSMGVTR